MREIKSKNVRGRRTANSIDLLDIHRNLQNKH